MKRTLLAGLALAAGSFALALPARAQDSERLTLAREVIEATGMNKMLDAMIPQVRQMTSQMIASQTASMSPAEKEAFDRFQDKAIVLTMESIKGALSKLDSMYAETFSAEDLKAFKAFYVSPAGKTMVAKQPELMQKLLPVVQAMQAELGPKIQALAGEFQQELAKIKATSTQPPAVSLPGVK